MTRKMVIGVYILLGGVAAILLGGFATSLMGVHFVNLHTEIDVDAPADVVWDVIADLDHYADWNPLMIKARGTAKKGEQMFWTSRINGKDSTYDAHVHSAVPGKELSWIGPISRPRRTLFWGHHTLMITPLPDGKVRFINKEGFGGLVTLGIQAFLKQDIHAHYEKMNRAVKETAEARYQAAK